MSSNEKNELLADPSALRYRVAEQKMQAEIDRFRSSPTPGVLTEELATARALLQDTLSRGADPRSAAMLLAVIQKLSSAHTRAGYLSNTLLSKEAVARCGEAILTAVHEEFEDVIGFEERFERLGERISGAVQNATNDPNTIP